MNMNVAVEKLLEVIKNDYLGWGGEMTPTREKMYNEFCANIEVLEGRKYIKIITNRSVWGFIVNVDNDKKFRKGDILKPASYDAPARNAARGNVFDDKYVVRWTGPLYLV